MSRLLIEKTFIKILHENVLSGDFRLANFKSNLLEFLKLIANTFSSMNDASLASVMEESLATVSSKLVASQFERLKVPKTSRVYLAAIYAAKVLGKELSTKEDLRSFLKIRYGPQLVLAADTLDLGLKHIGMLRGQKRKGDASDSEPASKRQKLIDPNTISLDSQEESEIEPPQRRARNPVTRYEVPVDGPLLDDFSAADYEEDAEIGAKEAVASSELKKRTQECFDFFTKNDIQLIADQTHKVKRAKIGDDFIEVDSPVIVLIDDDDSYAPTSQSASESCSNESSDGDGLSTDSVKILNSANTPKPDAKTDRSSQLSPAKSASQSKPASPIKSSPNKSMSPTKKKTRRKAVEETVLPNQPTKDQFASFLEYLASRRMNSEVFKQVTERLNAKEPLNDILAKLKPNFPFIPDSFLQCWFNAELVNVSNEDLLRDCANSLTPVMDGMLSLTIVHKVHIFVVGTVLDALHMQCSKEVRSNAPVNSDCASAVNEALMVKLEQSDAFKMLFKNSTIRRDFRTSSNKKEVFRAFKSEMKKFTLLCRIAPALIFNDASFHALITKSPSIDVLTKQWPGSPQVLPQEYLVTWPLIYPTPTDLSDNNNNN